MALVLSNSNPLCDLVANAKGSHVCARCALGALGKGIDQGLAAQDSKAFWCKMAEDLDFWNSQMRYMFSVRTEEQLKHLLDDLNRCSCRLRDRSMLEYHRLGRREEEQIASKYGMDTLPSSTVYFIFMFSCLGSLLGGNTNLKSVAKRTTRRWPTCPEDLIPFGPKNLVDSLVLWSKFIPELDIFSIATILIELCGSLLAPHAIKSPLTHHAIDAAYKLFDRTLSTLRLRSDNKRKKMGDVFSFQSGVFREYFKSFYEAQTVDKQAVMLDGYELKAVQIFSLLAYAADDPRLPLTHREGIVAELASQGYRIYRFIGLYNDPIPPVLFHPLICDEDAAAYARSFFRESPLPLSFFGTEGRLPSVHTEVTKPNAEYEASTELTEEEQEKVTYIAMYGPQARRAIDYLCLKRLKLECSARDCPNSIHQTGRTFQRCAGCSIASYCSKTCQANDWHGEVFPHKKMCTILRKARDKAGVKLLFGNISPLTHEGMHDFVALVIDKWFPEPGHVSLIEIETIVAWASYKRYTPTLPEKRECEPGFPDYEMKLAEMSERDGAAKPKSFPSKLQSTHEYQNLHRNLADVAEHFCC